MIELPLERTPDHESILQKEALLETLVPAALTTEVRDMLDGGYEVSFGSTPDRAYDSPEKILSVYERLQEGGKRFERASRRLALGSGAFALALEHSPIPQTANIRRRIKRQREALRSTILYDEPDVQGQPWHHQNGKALALATITDAHDLRILGSSEGEYDTMSGRLGDELTLDFRFPEVGVSENLAGKTLRDAVIEGKRAFRGSRSIEVADAAATKDLSQLQEFIDAPVFEGFKDIVAYCTDSLGIRSRKEEVRAEINRYADESDKDSLLMMSVGCGTALPMLEVVQDLRLKGRDAKMILLDQDPIALAAASKFAEQMGLEDAIEIHSCQLFVGNGRATRMMNLQDVLKGRELDICEDSGLREYFPDAMYEDLTRQAWDALADDGLMTTGNMNVNRPQAEFLHGLMGWPLRVRMRRIQDITRLHQKAGIPKEVSRLRVTQDGVYTLCFSSKKLSS